MTPRLIIVPLLMLNLTGCVAAIPLAQLATGATSVSQLCAATKFPGQTSSLCDRITTATQTSGKPTIMTTATR